MDTNVRSLAALLIAIILIGLILVGAISPTDGVPPSPSVIFVTNTRNPSPSPSPYTERGTETPSATADIIETWTKTSDPELTVFTSTISPFTATSSITLTSPSLSTAEETHTSTASASPATLSPSPSDLPTGTISPTEEATPTGEFIPTPSETPSQPPPQAGEESSTPIATTTSTPAATNSPTATTVPTEVAIPSFAIPDEVTFRWCLLLKMPRECVVVNDLTVTKRTPDELPPDLHLRCLDEVEIRNAPANTYSAFEFLRTSTAWVENCTFARNANTALSSGADAFAVSQSAHIHVKNVTAVFSVDGACDVNSSNDVEFENVVCGWALDQSTHVKGRHSTLMNIYLTTDFRCVNCLLANAQERLPQVVSSSARFSCLTVFNTGTLYGGRVDSTYGRSKADFRNVVLIPGLDSKPGALFLSLDEDAATGDQVWVDNPLLVRPGDRDKLSRVPVLEALPCSPVGLELLGARNRLTDLLVAGVRDRSGRIENAPIG